jgi:hypothetical protein
MRLQALVVPAATSDQLPHHHHDQTPQVKSDPIANKTSTIKNRAPSASTTTTTFLLLPTTTTTPPSPPPILENYVQESLTTLMVTPHLTDLPHSQCTSFRFWVIPTPSSGQQRYYLSLSLSLSLSFIIIIKYPPTPPKLRSLELLTELTQTNFFTA